MAARINPYHDAKTREKIKTSQLINRLEKIANGEVKAEPHQVTAALGLLKKTLPDLSAVAVNNLSDENAKQVFGWLPSQ